MPNRLIGVLLCIFHKRRFTILTTGSLKSTICLHVDTNTFRCTYSTEFINIKPFKLPSILLFVETFNDRDFSYRMTGKNLWYHDGATVCCRYLFIRVDRVRKTLARCRNETFPRKEGKKLTFTEFHYYSGCLLDDPKTGPVSLHFIVFFYRKVFCSPMRKLYSHHQILYFWVMLSTTWFCHFLATLYLVT